MRDVDKVALLKLHGCITDTHDEGCPLILSTDQYVDYTKGRNCYFGSSRTGSKENTIVYVGYGLADQDIRAILQAPDMRRVGAHRSHLADSEERRCHGDEILVASATSRQSRALSMRQFRL